MFQGRISRTPWEHLVVVALVLPILAAIGGALAGALLVWGACRLGLALADWTAARR